jgi:hypothetical protein
MPQWKDAFKPEHVRVKDIEVKERHRQDMGDIDTLAKSIDEVGLLQPLVVCEIGEDHYKLIAGQRRLQALIKLGRKNVAVRIAKELKDAVEMLRAERDENTCRKDLTPSEAVAVGRAIEELEKPKAKARQREGQERGRRRQQGDGVGGKLPPTDSGNGKTRAKEDRVPIILPIIGAGNLPPPKGDKGKTRDRVAEAVGMSGRTYDKAKAVVEAAEKEPDKHAETVKEMDRSGKVDAAYKKVQARPGPQERASQQRRPEGVGLKAARWQEHQEHLRSMLRQCKWDTEHLQEMDSKEWAGFAKENAGFLKRLVEALAALQAALSRRG